MQHSYEVSLSLFLQVFVKVEEVQSYNGTNTATVGRIPILFLSERLEFHMVTPTLLMSMLTQLSVDVILLLRYMNKSNFRGLLFPLTLLWKNASPFRRNFYPFIICEETMVTY